MDLKNILNQIEQADPEVFERSAHAATYCKALALK